MMENAHRRLSKWFNNMPIKVWPSILGATVPRDNVLNFNEEIPGGRYSSNVGSTESRMTASAAYEEEIHDQ